MINQALIDQILDIPITEILSKYITLKKKGATHEACCPFHEEKTPSFKVSSAKNFFNCFGCNIGGNSIRFIMEHKSVNFPEAVKIIAKDFNIEIPEKTLSKEEIELSRDSESIKVVNQIAAKFYINQLYNKKTPAGLNYSLKRWEETTIKEFGIGFALDQWTSFHDYAKKQGVKTEILIKSGLCREKNNRVYDVFKNRLIFPIKNKFGRVIGFSGRSLSENKKYPKYINTQETKVYSKSKSLFGIDTAWNEIARTGIAYLVEGVPDVIRLSELEIYNVVASCGTALTLEQINILKSACDSINIIGDTDQAGITAVERSAKLIISKGINCNVIMLPKEKKKNDPDSFFKNKKQFSEYESEHIQDYIIYLANKIHNFTKDPNYKLKAINEIARLIINYDDPACHELYINQLSDFIKPRKAWSDKIRELLKDSKPGKSEKLVPDHVSFQDWQKYGFYADRNCYYFQIKGKVIRGSNFTMQPLFHIKSVSNAKRLYKITNEFNYSCLVELAQRDLVSLGRFKERVESLGNFLWEASETELNKLKRYLYENTESCIEVTQLGWQKEGHWAWGNGIFSDKFIPIDNNGISRTDNNNYYLPAFSDVYKDEKSLFISERNFIHRDKSDITLKDYSKLFIEVFGDNAIIAICFYVATLFRDVILRTMNFYPILCLFGPKGAGKTELAVSILQFFGKQSKGPNINSTSKPALADHISQTRNSCSHIDEYTNNMELEKVEFLKGLWDLTGRTRMNMDKDKKKETTAVDCGIMLSGQQMPTVDIALFTRLIYLSFFKHEFTASEKEKFKKLKRIERLGLTHITHEILKHRDYFIENINKNYEKVSRDLLNELKNEIIMDRIFNNWLIILAAFHTLDSKINVSFTYTELLSQAVDQIKIQNRESQKSGEISSFWNIIQYLYAEGLILEEVDYKIISTSKLKTDSLDIIWPEPKNILFIQHSRIFILYRKHGKQSDEKILPIDSIDYYLRNDKRFLGKKASVSFKAVNPKTGYETSTPMETRRKITRAYAFLYDDLEINLSDFREDVNIYNIGNKPTEKKKVVEPDLF